MRNLKKTLCLVLALVFVLGLCTVGAAGVTDFEDVDEILYKTEVKAMAGLGIIIGDDNDFDGNTEFRPKDNVTRAEAAKIIAYVMVGPDVEKWPAKQVFDDVPADHWAAKYITFCEYNKVIVGYGNGKFGPSDPVTKAQLAKMLLSACGYGAKDEFIGEGWDQNVAALAFQCDVLKNIQSTDDWNSYANREETALMCYNTMMRTYRVVLSEDTTSYVPEYINNPEYSDGEYATTFAQSPWNLHKRTGVVMYNKANTKNIKGTYIAFDYTITSTTNATTGAVTYRYNPSGVYVETGDDENAAILGHEVTVMYREEGDGFTRKNVAYCLIDDCEEVSGTQANSAEYAGVTCTVEDGYVTIPYTGYAKNERYKDYSGKYILNGEGELVGVKKAEVFEILPITINPYTGTATVTPTGSVIARDVIAPEGVKNGDLVCVYQCGEIYSARAITKVENVAITQKEETQFFPSYFTYNNGEIVPTKAANKTSISLASLTAVNPQLAVVAAPGTIEKYEPYLKVNYTYTLYFDDKGGCFAYGDERPSNETEVSYVMFVADFSVKDAYGTDQYYAQVIKADGSIERILLKAASGLTYGDVCTIKSYGFYSELVKETKNAYHQVAYDFGRDPQYDFTNTKYVHHNGQKLSALYVADTTSKPVANKTVSVAFKVVKVGTTYINQVAAIWFVDAAGDPNATNSYVYVLADDVTQIRAQELINGKTVNFYKGYKDGEELLDLKIEKDDINDPVAKNFIGFNKYYKNADGEYVLTPVDPGTGAKTGVRNIYLLDADAALKGVSIESNNYCFILNGKLWVMNDSNVRFGINLTDVKFIRIDGEYTLADQLAGIPYPYQLPLDEVSAIQNLLMSRMKDEDGNEHQFKIDVTFVEIVGMDGSHSIGGATIYITGVSEYVKESETAK